MQRFLTFILIALFLTACNQETTGSENGSYSIIVVVNDIAYTGIGEAISAYEKDVLISKVTKKVKPEIFPKNTQSNFFAEGSLIYSVKNTTDYIIVEDVKGIDHLLQNYKE